MKVREIIKLLDLDGWVAALTEENIRQYKRLGLKERITIGGRLDDDLDERLVDNILRHAQLRKGEA
jgi:predicted RNA binding protein YcfA (HicA-like mRNA interferase family)